MVPDPPTPFPTAHPFFPDGESRFSSILPPSLYQVVILPELDAALATARAAGAADRRRRRRSAPRSHLPYSVQSLRAEAHVSKRLFFVFKNFAQASGSAFRYSRAFDLWVTHVDQLRQPH